jgi:hypothetical protein
MTTMRVLIVIALTVFTVWAQLAQISPRTFGVQSDVSALLDSVVRFAPSIAALLLTVTVLWIVTLERRIFGLTRTVETARSEAIDVAHRVEEAAHQSASETAVGVRVPLERRIANLERRLDDLVPLKVDEITAARRK